MEIEAEMAMARYSPLSVDSYGAVSDGGVSDSAAILTINMMDQTSPPRVQTHVHPPLYSAQTRSLSDPNFLHQHQLVNASPGVPYCIDDSMIDFDAIEALALLEPHSDLGPPPMPVRLTRLDEEPPKNKESARLESAYARVAEQHFMDRSNPNSPLNSSDTGSLPRARRTAHVHDVFRLSGRGGHPRGGRTSKSPRNHMRGTSPMFPDHSMPLSTVSVSRHPSSASLASTRSDPSRHSVLLYDDPHTLQNGVDSTMNSPSISVHGDSNSPKFTFGQQTPGLLTNTTKSNMEVEMPMKFARKITELDRRILKLQAERSKLLEKAQQNKSDTPPAINIEEKWPLPVEKVAEKGRVHLYIFPLGIHALDEPLYEEASTLLRHVGGLHYDLQSKIVNLRNMCCKGMSSLPEISTCFAYIKSLLLEHQKLKLTCSITGLYRLDTELHSGEIVPQEFVDSLCTANDVLKSAQHITHTNTHIQTKLQQVQELATQKVVNCDDICQNLGILDRERRTQIRSVLEGNCTAVASAIREWPQYYRVATETIQAITECVHPPSQGFM